MSLSKKNKLHVIRGLRLKILTIKYFNHYINNYKATFFIVGKFFSFSILNATNKFYEAVAVQFDLKPSLAATTWTFEFPLLNWRKIFLASNLVMG